MVRQFTMIIFFLCQLSFVCGQIAKGTVKDEQTGEALPFANVFIDNTTMGTTTNVDGKFSFSVPAGFALMVISYVGYQTQSFNINPVVTETLEFNISLKSEKKELKEVQIESTRDKQWEKNFRSFEKEFLGTTPNGKKSKILNPWVVNFVENDRHVLIATATEPIEIENKGLGYHVLFYMMRFEAGDQLYLLGRTRFTELETEDEKQRSTWMKHRTEAYLGAEQHLFRAMIEGKVFQEGFELFVEKKEHKQIMRTGRFSQELKDNLMPFSFNMMKGVSDIYKIRLPGRIEVHYVKDDLHPFYKDVPDRVFWIEPLQTVIEVNRKGVIRDPTSILESGYLRSLRIADMLPFDFEPPPPSKEE